MHTVLLPEPIHAEGRKMLEGKVRIVEAPDFSPEILRPLMPDADAIILRTRAKMTRELIQAGQKLKVIARTGAGVDNVDVEAATEREIYICHNPHVNTVSVAEQVLAFLLILAKQIPLLDREVRKGNFGIRYEYLPVNLAGKVLGLVGFGKIGREVAKKAGLGLQMEVQAFDPYLSPSKIAAGGARPAKDMKELFSSSHVVSIHVPLNEETRGLVGKSLLACMRPDAMLINTSRGGIIDEEALAEALRERRIGGAGIDVFAEEPPSQENPLLDLPNVVVTPHSSALTKECAAKMATEAVRQTLEVLSGREPEFVFNREGLKTRMELKETKTDG